MNETKYKVALDLLQFKAAKQFCEGKTTCTLNEDDVKEILFVAGMTLDREVEVIK